MPKFKFEYIWLDGSKPEADLRSKTKILELKTFNGETNKLPIWSFDGSSTQQAEGHTSDCLLKPVAVYPDADRINGYLVICEVLNPNGSPHPSNKRALIEDDLDFWFGFEQEYVLMANKKPLGFPKQGFPPPQGPYYCGVGNGRVEGRSIVEEHLDLCLDAGLTITGINAEVLLGQWEYQCFAKGAKKAADDLMLSRYLLYRVTEQYGIDVNLHPKPIKGDWNGSGMHCNFSNKEMRDKGGKKLFTEICEAFRPVHKEHMAVYGSKNDQRLTGKHETQSIDAFSYGISDRGASIRIPVNTAANWKGYLEDRRPASNADPYLITNRIIQTVKNRKTISKGKSNGKQQQVATFNIKPKAKKTDKKKGGKEGKVKTTKMFRKISKVRAKDNLKKIEGIGPKIEQLLNKAGIKTFENLAEASIKKLKGILAEAGRRYVMHNPSTWPKQSKLAADGKWDKLASLQNRIRPTRKK